MRIDAKPSPKLTWTPAPKELDRRCTCTLIYGDTSTAKTTLALDWPDPILFLSSAENDRGKLERYSEKDIMVMNFRKPTTDIETLATVKEDAKKLEDEFRERFCDAIMGLEGKGGWARTIIVDTIHGLRELQRQADFGGLLVSKRAVKYGPSNSRFAQLNLMFKEQADISNQTNLVYIARTTEEYIKNPSNPEDFGAPTGKRVYDSYKTAYSDSEIRVRTYFSIEEKEFRMKVEKAYLNARTTGDELKGHEFSFEGLMRNQFDINEKKRQRLTEEAGKCFSEGESDKGEKLLEQVDGLEFNMEQFL